MGWKPWAVPISSAICAQEPDIDQRIGRIGRRLDQDDRYPSLAARLLRGGPNGGLAHAVDEADGADAEICHGARQQGFRSAVERLGVQNDVAGADEGQDRRGDRRHARSEQHAGLRALVDREPVLDDLAVGMVEARVDEAGGAALGRLLASRDIVEEVATFLGRAEHEGRREEDRRLHRALRQSRIVAIAQHHGLGLQGMVADMGLGRARRGHGVSPVTGLVTQDTSGRGPRACSDWINAHLSWGRATPVARHGLPDRGRAARAGSRSIRSPPASRPPTGPASAGSCRPFPTAG